MSDVMEKPVQLVLCYYVGPDDPQRGIFATRPVDPEFTEELRIGVYIDDDSSGFPAVLDGKALQIQFAGTSRALAAFGAYLFALARLESPDPDPHEHFEEVRDDRGGTVHLIVRRT